MISIGLIVSNAKNAANQTLNYVSGSESLQAQLNGTVKLVSTMVSSVALTIANPVLGIANMAMMGISASFQQAKYNREKAWFDYEIDQYNQRRGLSALSNRTRSG